MKPSETTTDIQKILTEQTSGETTPKTSVGEINKLPPDQLSPPLTRNRINQKILAAITIFLLGISQIPEEAKADANCTNTLEQTFKEQKHIMNKYFSKAAVISQLISDPRKTTLQKAMKEFFIYYSLTIKEQRSLLKSMQEDGHCYTLDRFYALNDDFTERAQQFNTFMESLY